MNKFSILSGSKVQHKLVSRIFSIFTHMSEKQNFRNKENLFPKESIKNFVWKNKHAVNTTQNAFPFNRSSSKR